jgi:hypothetical protein
MMDWGDWGEAGGGGNHPAQNPPPLSEHDEFVMAWAAENLNGFVKDFGLMPILITELNLNEMERILFIKKLDLIYRYFLEREEKNWRSKYAKN